MKDNFIIHQEAKKYEWIGDCFLSIKSFYCGKADYTIKQREYRVDPNNFLVLNECTKYRLTIDTQDKTGSFCVFFSPEFVSEVFSALNSSDSQLLDFAPKKQNGVKLLETNYPQSGMVSVLLDIGRKKSNSSWDPLEQEEYYHTLLNALLFQNNERLIDAEQLSSKKKSTREELYQRIMYVKDFLDANYHKSLRLRELAEIGLLSENHLLRNFNRIFGISPFQYISQKRIQEAKRQLLNSDTPIKDIALDVGYSSFSNFSSYFKAIVGTSPNALRKGDI